MPNKFLKLWQENCETIDIGGNDYHIIRRDEWIYRSSVTDCQIEYMMIAENILYSKNSGYTKTEDIHKIFACLDTVLRDLEMTREQIYRISDLNDFRGGTLFSRKTANDYFNSDAYKIIGMYLFGMKTESRVMYKFLSSLNPGKYRNWFLCDSLETAMEMIQQDIKGLNTSIDNTLPASLSIPDSKKEIETLIHQLYKKIDDLEKYQATQVEKLVEALAKITWSMDFEEPRIKLPSNDPFTDVFNAISLLRKDVKELLQEQEIRADALRESERQYRQMAQKLLTIQDEERQRLSREIHDSLGAYLTTVLIRCGILGKIGGKENRELKNELEEIEGLLNGAFEECYRLSFELSPPSIIELGLVQAMKEVVNGFSSRSNISVTFTESIGRIVLTKEQNLMFFRILQEAINNITKHAQAKKVRIHFGTEDDHIWLSIADDGKGFDLAGTFQQKTGPREQLRGFGLMSMRERAANLGGNFEITSKVGTGTDIVVTIPKPDPDNNPYIKENFRN